jgi:hypothetical protein
MKGQSGGAMKVSRVSHCGHNKGACPYGNDTCVLVLPMMESDFLFFYAQDLHTYPRLARANIYMSPSR